MNDASNNRIGAVELAALVLAAALQIAAVMSLLQELRCSAGSASISKPGLVVSSADGDCKSMP